KRRERNEPRAVAESLDHIGCDLQREPRLSDASRSDDRDQTPLGQRVAELSQLAFATDEARDLKRQVVRSRIHRSQRGKVRAQAGRDDLKCRLRLAEVLEAMRSEAAWRRS